MTTHAEVRAKYPNAYQSWNENEEAILRASFSTGLSIDELANLLGRQPSAIQSRLEKMGLVEPTIRPIPSKPEPQYVSLPEDFNQLARVQLLVHHYCQAHKNIFGHASHPAESLLKGLNIGRLKSDKLLNIFLNLLPFFSEHKLCADDGSLPKYIAFVLQTIKNARQNSWPEKLRNSDLVRQFKDKSSEQEKEQTSDDAASLRSEFDKRHREYLEELDSMSEAAQFADRDYSGGN